MNNNNKLFNEIKTELFNNIKNKNYLIHLGNIDFKYINNDFLVIFNDKVIYEMTRNIYKDTFFKIIKKNIQNDNLKITFVDNKKKFIENHKVNLIDLYSKKNIDFILKFLKKHDLNFLYLFGDTGYGKTFFLKYVCEKYNKNFVVINTIEFFNEIQKIFYRKNYEMLNNITNIYKKYQILIFDNIEYINNKKHSSVFLANFINDFLSNNKSNKIFFISDRNYKDINEINKQIRDFFIKSILFKFEPLSLVKIKKFFKYQYQTIFHTNKDCELILNNFIENYNYKDLNIIRNYLNNLEMLINSNINIKINLVLEKLNDLYKFKPKNTKKDLNSKIWKKQIFNYLSNKNIDISILKSMIYNNKEIEFIKKVIVYYLRKYIKISYEEIGYFLNREKTNIHKKYNNILKNKDVRKKVDEEINSFFIY